MKGYPATKFYLVCMVTLLVFSQYLSRTVIVFVFIMVVLASLVFALRQVIKREKNKK